MISASISICCSSCPVGRWGVLQFQQLPQVHVPTFGIHLDSYSPIDREIFHRHQKFTPSSLICLSSLRMAWQLQMISSLNDTSTLYASNSSTSYLSTTSDGAFPVYYEPEVNTTESTKQGDEDNGCSVFQFVINTLVIGALCIFGVAGNLVSMVILQRDRHNRVAVFLLQSLAIADSSVLIIAFVVLTIFYGLLPIIGLRDTVIQASSILIQVRIFFLAFVARRQRMVRTTLDYATLIGITRY